MRPRGAGGAARGEGWGSMRGGVGHCAGSAVTSVAGGLM